MAMCSYSTSTGRNCTNTAIYMNDAGQHLCHLRGHSQNKFEYAAFIDRSTEQFDNETLPVDPTDIINTRGDGACFYRVCAKYILSHSELFPDIPVEAVQSEDELARFIQQRIVDFIELNPDTAISQLGGQTLEDAVTGTHEDISSFEEYITIYQQFAGEPDYIIDETFLNGRKKKCKIPIPDRWGSSLEQLVFSMIYGVKMNVHILQKFDKRFCQVKEVTKRAKDIRLKLYQQFNPELEGVDIERPVLNIILESQNTSPHYLFIDNDME